MSIDHGLNRLENLLDSQRRIQQGLIRSLSEVRDPVLRVPIEISISTAKNVIINLEAAIADIRTGMRDPGIKKITLDL